MHLEKKNVSLNFWNMPKSFFPPQISQNRLELCNASLRNIEEINF